MQPTPDPSAPNEAVHRAKWIVLDPWHIVQDGWLRTAGGTIQEVGQGRSPQAEKILDHGAGVLMPSLVNAHTHLELCALAGKISWQRGFIQWVEALLRARAQTGLQDLVRGARMGIKELLASGCGLVGEIATLGLTFDLLQESGLGGIWFKEYLGNDPPDTYDASSDRTDLKFALAGHAPHTTSPDVLINLKRETGRQKALLSLHLAESAAETAFCVSRSGAWAQFLSARGIDHANWDLPQARPVQAVDRLGLLDESTLAVHLTFADRQDLAVLSARKVKVCVCPRSNVNLHSRLPDLKAMWSLGIEPALGTDSLASVTSLSVFDEMRFCAEVFGELAPEKILAMATLNGAKALGFEGRYGRLAPDHKAVFLYLPLQADTTASLLEHIVRGQFAPPRLIGLERLSQID